MKLDKYDGTTSIDSFLAKFEICAVHNGWGEKERFAQLRCVLTNDAAQILWDMDSEKVTTSAGLISQLRARHGYENQTHSNKAQLRGRRRIQGESSAALAHDVRRVVTFAYPGPPSTVRDTVACDAFLEALDDPEMALRIREREPESLEQVLRVAQRLESYRGAKSKYSSERVDNDAREHCRTIHETVNGAPDDLSVGCLKELKQQQEHMQQLIEELEAVVSTTQSASGKIETGDRTRAQKADLIFTRSRRQRRPAITCYSCGGQGHYRRQCPRKQGNRPVELVSPGATMAANRHIKGQSGLYLRMKIEKKWCLALVDTGSEITLVPRLLVEGAVLEASNQRLQAANGTEIMVKGETTISVDLGSFRIPLKCLVVEDLTEILIGMDWLLENAATIDLKNQRIGIGGRIFGLAKATPDRAVRRVESRKSVEIPPKSEANLEGRVLYSDLSDYNGSWVTQPKRLKEALLVARTLVADCGPAVVIRLINLSSKSVLLEEGDA